MNLPQTLFKHLPEESFVWVHAADRRLSETEAAAVVRSIEEFLQTWTSHKRNVQGDSLLLDNQILILGAFVPDGELSGCGIDKHMHILDRVADNFTFKWTGGLSVLYRDMNDQIAVVSRSEFKRLVAEQNLPLSTRVFDLSISSLTEARIGVERTAVDSWHADQFPFSSAVENPVMSGQTSRTLQ